MVRIAPLFALTLLAACDRQAPPPPPATVKVEAPAPVAKAAIPSLDGQWRLTTPAALDLSVGDGRATLSSGCLRRGYTYVQKGSGVTFASAPAGSTNCGRTPSVAEETAFAILTDVNLAIFAADGRSVTLSGLGGMLALERR